VSHGIDPVAHGQSAVHGQGGMHGMGAANRILRSVATTLGVDPTELRGDLRSGQSLADVAAAKSVSSEDLLAAVTQALSTQHGQSGAHGPFARLGLDSSTLAQQIIDSTSWFGGAKAAAGRAAEAGPEQGSLVDVVA
jgi:hypothetical protein